MRDLPKLPNGWGWFRGGRSGRNYASNGYLEVTVHDDGEVEVSHHVETLRTIRVPIAVVVAIAEANRVTI